MVVSGVRSSCEASAANCLTFCSDRSRASNACWIRSSIVLIAAASRPVSSRSPASGIRAARSPLRVISAAVDAIRRSGARALPISQLPQTTSRAMSTLPVIASASTRPRTLLVTALVARPTTRTAGPAGKTCWSVAVAAAGRTCQAARTAGRPLSVMLNGAPAGASCSSRAEACCAVSPFRLTTSVRSAADVGERAVSVPAVPSSSER